MGLEARLNHWNGENKTDLQAIYKQFYRNSDFIDQLLPLLKQKQQLAASWLLKDHLQAGHSLNDQQKRLFFKAFPLARHWQTQLHLLQSLPYIRPVPDVAIHKLEIFLRQEIQSDNKFVRAWAYNGFYDLAQDYPQYRETANQLIQQAQEDEAASVQARVRQLDMF